MTRIRLLSTDFDGTLISHGSDGRCSSDLAAALDRHHRAGGLWAINTGRSLDHGVEGIERFDAPIPPDFLLTLEREVFRRERSGGWQPHGDWNSDCIRRHDELFEQAGGVLETIEGFAERSGEATVLYENGVMIGLVTDTEEAMDRMASKIDEHSKHLEEFGYQRNTVYLRFCHRDYHKGSALGELCRLEDIAAESVLAAGDHFNDLSMLDGRYAAMTACPSNAIEPVKTAVRRSGGFIAQRESANGIADAIAFFSTSSIEAAVAR